MIATTNQKRRVVVTGMGLVTPLGVGVEHVWNGLKAGKSGVRPVERVDTTDLPTKYAAQVPRGKGAGEFDPASFLDHQEQRRYEDFLQYAIGAAVEAMADAKWKPANEAEADRAGVLVGSGVGGMERIAENALLLAEKGPRKVSPFFIPMSLINEASGLISMRFNLRGPCHSVVTACATGAHAIGDAARLIEYGDADVMLAGGTEAAVCRLTLAGFTAMRALSSEFNDAPHTASRPWDKKRDGFVLGEGAGVVVLESLEHAQARGARIHGELLGYGLSGDAHHLSAPAPDGNGARRAMEMALRHAGRKATELDYVNAHATSTPVGDPIELTALRALLGGDTSRVSVSSTKSSIAHLLGAAGAVEAIITLLALRDQIAPPTINLHEPEGAEGIDLVPNEARSRRIELALSNSFGFGGTNAALVMSRFQA
ncbi:MAG: beta-ketoacyl-ACP synthase II [Archangium sp.]